MTLRLPSPCLVVLAGPPAAGKSTWAAAHFRADSIVTSDRLRAVVGAGEVDIAASADAFALLEEIVTRRVARGLTTVIDSTGTDAARRDRWRGLARTHGIPCVAVAFDTPAAHCRARNRTRTHPVPADALTAQLRAWPAVRDALAGEGFDAVLAPVPVRVVPPVFADAAAAVDRQRGRPVGLRFALHLSAFPGGAATLAPRLREIAAAAGFDAIYVMDHFRHRAGRRGLQRGRCARRSAASAWGGPRPVRRLGARGDGAGPGGPVPRARRGGRAEVAVRLPDLTDPTPLARFARVIAAFR